MFQAHYGTQKKQKGELKIDAGWDAITASCWGRLAVSIDKNRLLRSFGTSIRRPDQHRIFDASFVVAARTARLRSRACYAMQRGHDRKGDEWPAARPELSSVD
jgi:hypothetical protein